MVFFHPLQRTQSALPAQHRAPRAGSAAENGDAGDIGTSPDGTEVIVGFDQRQPHRAGVRDFGWLAEQQISCFQMRLNGLTHFARAHMCQPALVQHGHDGQQRLGVCRAGPRRALIDCHRAVIGVNRQIQLSQMLSNVPNAMVRLGGLPLHTLVPVVVPGEFFVEDQQAL